MTWRSPLLSRSLTLPHFCPPAGDSATDRDRQTDSLAREGRVWKLEQFERSMIADPMHIADMPPLSFFPSPYPSCFFLCLTEANVQQQQQHEQQQRVAATTDKASCVCILIFTQLDIRHRSRRSKIHWEKVASSVSYTGIKITRAELSYEINTV